MTAMSINSTPYVLPATTTAASQLFANQDLGLTLVMLVKNSGTVPVFICTSASAGTAVFPTATTPSGAVYPAPTSVLNGTVVLPGCVETLSKGAQDAYMNFITSSGTATVYVQVGYGE